MNFQTLMHALHHCAFLMLLLIGAGYVFSLAARLYWAFDLFSHFTLQYTLGALILGLFFLLSREWWLALVCIVILSANIVEMRMLMREPLRLVHVVQAPDLTMIQFNKFYRNMNYAAIGAWLQMHENDVDIVFIQESGIETAPKLEALRSAFPYQFPETGKARYNDVTVFSRWPMTAEYVRLQGYGFTKFATRVALKKDNANSPVVIYSMHTITPMNEAMQARRNGELSMLAEAVRKDTSKYVIASGDWNITPYSPYFADFLKVSDLNYQNYGFLPVTSWPSFNYISVLKIPIDQVLFKNSLNLLNIEKGPSMGSDHHPLIASFALNKHD